MDFPKTFDRVSHSTLITKLYHPFGITDGMQYTVVNGTSSDKATVSAGILVS